MKHTIKKTMFVHAEKAYFGEEEFKLNLMACDMSKYGYILIGEVEVSVDYDLPDNAPHEGPGGFSPGPLDAVVGRQTEE